MDADKNEKVRLVYFQKSRTNIDDFIYNKQYNNAFALLILVLQKLNENEKKELVDYYADKLGSLFQ
jgi:hypothetical protein